MKTHDLEQLKFDLEHYTNRDLLDKTYLGICEANESLLDSIRSRFSPMEARERGRSRAALRVMKFSTYGKTMFGVQRGFVGQLMPYLESMEGANMGLIEGYNDAMPKYSEALSQLLQRRVLPDYYSKPLNDTVKDQEVHSSNLGKYYSGDKEWSRLNTIFKKQDDLGDVYSLAEAPLPILDTKWLAGVEQDVTVNTKYMRSMHASMRSTSDAEYKALIRKAGSAGYGMAKLVELVGARAWETTSCLRVVKNIRLKTIKDLL